MTTARPSFAGGCFALLALVALAGCDSLKSLKEVQQEIHDTAQWQNETPEHTFSRPSDDEEPAPESAPPTPEPVKPATWDEILGPSQAVLPEPLPELTWRSDLRQALAEAAAAGRPLFVVVRCPESMQFADLDDAVTNPKADLGELLRQFVTVRITRGDDIDLAMLPVEGFQDMDVSWWGWFLSDAGAVYGVFGGHDAESDARRVSPSALATSLRRVLEHHYDPRRLAWNIDGPAADLSQPARAPHTLPAYSSWFQKSIGSRQLECLRCHHVGEAIVQERLDREEFDKQKEMWVWPLPENVGLTFDRDDGLTVSHVTLGSPAEIAGLKIGDVLGAAEKRRLFGATDFQAALHRGPLTAGTVEVHWLRDGEVMQGFLKLPHGWRKTDLSWRPSIIYGQIGAVPGFLPEPLPAGLRRRLRIPDGTMAVVPRLIPQSPAYQAGLRPDLHVVVSVDVLRPDLSGREYIVWFRTHFNPGQEITLTTVSLRDGKTSRITYEAPRYTAP